MNKVLFETGYLGDISGNVNIVLAFGLYLFLYFRAKSVEKEEKQKGREKNAKLLSVIAKGILILVLTEAVFLIKEYKNIVISYKNGNYVEIEGVVEGYHESSKGIYAYFSVDGVPFQCSSGEPAWGYKKQESNLRGRHLRIRYIPSGEWNVIVYMEQMMPEEWETD